ncbi:MAG: hypothetical protein V1696_01635 [Candidatus Jorgensenbacteria bacterium]
MPQSQSPLKLIMRFFDRLEDRIRSRLSRHPVPYALIGGFGIVLFWRGVWHTADILQTKGGWLGWLFYEPINLLIVIIILLITGLFVSYFIGDTILVSGLKHEKKITEKTEEEVQAETNIIMELHREIHEIRTKLEEISKRMNGPGAN